MFIKLLSFVLACVTLFSCASAPRPKEWVRGGLAESAIAERRAEGEQTFTFEGLTYDRVWEACERTLINLGYLFAVAEKREGVIRVQGTAKPAISTPTLGIPEETRHVLVLVKKTNGSVAVQASLLVPDDGKSRLADVPAAKNEVDRFFKSLKKRLK